MSPWVLALFLTVTVSVIGAGQWRILAEIVRSTNFLDGRITMSQQDAVNAVVEQLTKVNGEIVSEIESLQAQVEAAGVADQVDLSALTAIAQQLDDIVPDAAVVAPGDVEGEVVETLPGQVDVEGVDTLPGDLGPEPR